MPRRWLWSKSNSARPQDRDALNQSAFAKVADVAAAGAFDHVDRELEQTNFPRIVDALDDRTEMIVVMLDVRFCALNHRFDRIAKHLFGHVGFAELKTITQHRHVLKSLAKLLSITLRFLAKPFEQQT